MSRDALAAVPALRWAVYRSVFALGPWVPLCIARGMGWGLGWLWWWADPRGRRTVAANLLGLARRRGRHLPTLVRLAFCRAGLGMAEGLRLGRLPAGEAAPPRFRIVDPWRRFARLPLQGPAIFATVHGNWELMPALCRRRGVFDTLHVFSLTHEDPRIDALFHRARARLGIESLLLDRAPLAGLRALKAGAVFGLVADRDYSGHGLWVDLLGRPVRLPTGPATLALQAGVPLVPVLLARAGWTRSVLLLGPPLRPPAGLGKRAQIEALTRDMAAVFSRFLHAIPDQWVVFHRFWP
jgi:lauroyl/myristoyl acyltransferase